MTDEPECMTCNGATTYDLATRQLFFGSIPLCFLHAELMRETIADAEWREGSGAMTDEQKQEAEIVQVGLDSLAFIDRTIYCNEDNPATVLWKNSEVMELLADIRAIVIADLLPQLPIGVSAP